MADKIILKKDSKTSKKLFHLKRNVFMLYAPRNIKIEPTEFQIIDSGVLALTPKGGRGFVTSKYKEDETIEISSEEQRLLVEIINRSCTSPIRMAKGCVLAFKISIWDDNKKIKKAKKKYQKTLSWKKKKQIGVFLNRYYFAYAGRDTIDEAAKVGPGVIKNASNEINNIAKERINQIITQG